MVLSDISIRRPVLASVMSIIIVVVGAISYTRLATREYPNIDVPVVSVRSVYSGASAEIMESQVTTPLEEALSGISGVKTLKSISREEVSEINLEFLIDQDPDAAAADVRDRVSRVSSQLPREMKPPVISKIEADAEPIMWLGLFSSNHNPMEITDIGDRYVQDRLQVLPGVAQVIFGGDRRWAMRIWLDRDRLAAYSLSPADVEDALRRQNLEVPSGRIESSMREFTVLTETDLKTPEEFESLIIREVGGYPIRLRDVGRAELGAEATRSKVRVSGADALGVGIVKQATANTLEVARLVKEEIKLINQSMPEGAELIVSSDVSLFIEESLKAVYSTIVEALALVAVVIFLFLRSPRATLIPLFSIPVALVGAFIFLQALGFSINILTLLALVLAIGLVVDDAIVVMENIYRRIEEGSPPVQAAFEGSREIGFALIAMTLTLVAVFVPLSFMTGTTGNLFREFSLALVGAVLVSGFVALTLVPMLCSKILRPEYNHGKVFQTTERWLDNLNSGYGKSLEFFLARRILVVIGGLLTIGLMVILFFNLRSELSPAEDRGLFVAFMIAPEGSTVEYTDRYAYEVEDLINKIPEVEIFFSAVSPGRARPTPVNKALAFVTMKHWDDRDRTQFDVVKELAPKLFGLPGVFAFAMNPPSLGQPYQVQPVNVVVQGSSYAELEEISNKVMQEGRGYPGLLNLDSDLKLNKPQLRVSLDRDKVANVGASVADIGRTLETLLGGREVTRFKKDGEQYEVIVKIEDSARTKPSDMNSIYVRGNQQELVQLSNLVEIKETVAPKELNHFNRLRAVTFTASPGPGYVLSESLDYLINLIKEVAPTARIELDGISKEFMESGNSMYITFALSLVFIYLVLAAQFESFRDPLIIMLSVPLAVTGALLSLFLTGGSLNVYSQIGMVMLIGLVAKNGILIVEFANQLQLRGKEIHSAVVEASVLRLRPILMTSATMILAAIPLALSSGAGAESRQPIGWVVVGGLTFGSLLTLFVIPTAYSLLGSKKKAMIQAPQVHPAQ